MTGNRHQILIWFDGNLKRFRVQTEILAAVFDWISKQQLSLLLFMLGLTDLPDHDGKVKSDRKMIFATHQRYNVEDRDYCSHISATFGTTGKFLTVF